jgi:predicted  nucleic acid-binding Zn-ribbon protein
MAADVLDEATDHTVEYELADLRRRVQTHNDLIANLVTRVQSLEQQLSSLQVTLALKS